LTSESRGSVGEEGGGGLRLIWNGSDGAVVSPLVLLTLLGRNVGRGSVGEIDLPVPRARGVADTYP